MGCEFCGWVKSWWCVWRRGWSVIGCRDALRCEVQGEGLKRAACNPRHMTWIYSLDPPFLRFLSSDHDDMHI